MNQIKKIKFRLFNDLKKKNAITELNYDYLDGVFFVVPNEMKLSRHGFSVLSYYYDFEEYTESLNLSHIVKLMKVFVIPYYIFETKHMISVSIFDSHINARIKLIGSLKDYLSRLH